MPFVQWDESMNLGKASIDQQHRGLFDLVNILYEAMGSKAEAEVVEDCVDAMSRYCLEHFRDEENYMALIGFPDLPTHKELHQAFMQQTSVLVDALDQGQSPFQEALFALVRWLDEHIRQEDVRYIQFARDNGLAAEPD